MPRACPVTNSFSARNRAAWATSSGVPMRPKGVSWARAVISAGERIQFIGVSITPGQMQFTRMPEGPSSWARAWVSPITAALEAE